MRARDEVELKMDAEELSLHGVRDRLEAAGLTVRAKRQRCDNWWAHENRPDGIGVRPVSIEDAGSPLIEFFVDAVRVGDVGHLSMRVYGVDAHKAEALVPTIGDALRAAIAAFQGVMNKGAPLGATT